MCAMLYLSCALCRRCTPLSIGTEQACKRPSTNFATRTKRISKSHLRLCLELYIGERRYGLNNRNFEKVQRERANKRRSRGKQKLQTQRPHLRSL
jgi:hypothetical protein